MGKRYWHKKIEIKYNDKVKIIDGFHRGYLGRIVDEDPRLYFNYIVELTNGDKVYIPDYEMEKID